MAFCNLWVQNILNLPTDCFKATNPVSTNYNQSKRRYPCSYAASGTIKGHSDCRCTVQTERAEIAGHAVRQVTFPPSGQKVK
jgi:hypothetical protein